MEASPGPVDMQIAAKKSKGRLCMKPSLPTLAVSTFMLLLSPTRSLNVSPNIPHTSDLFYRAQSYSGSRPTYPAYSIPNSGVPISCHLRRRCHPQNFRRRGLCNTCLSLKSFQTDTVSNRFSRNRGIFMTPSDKQNDDHDLNSETESSKNNETVEDGNEDEESSFEPPATPFVGMPTTKQMLVFIATTVLVWVSEPLLSLVDSAVVGSFAGRSSQSLNAIRAVNQPNLSSVIQLAALGPATMLCDSAIYLTYFIGLAATNQLARASAKRNWKAQIEASSYNLGVSVALGVLVTAILFIFGENLLRSIIGPGGAIVQDLSGKSIDMTEKVVHIALGYTRIRSIGAIFAITGSTAQSLLLSVLDTPTVALAVIVATVCNTFGDVALVAWNGWGVWGAALATTFATIASNVFLIWKERKLVHSWREAFWVEKYGVERNFPYFQNDRFNDESVPNVVSKRIKQKQEIWKKEYEEFLVEPFVSFPDKKSFFSLFRIAGPIFSIIVGKVVEFWAMTVAAGNFGMVSLACHNILMRVFFFFATFGDGLAQAAQTFLPGLFVKVRKKEKMHKGATTEGNTSVLHQKNDKNAVKMPAQSEVQSNNKTSPFIEISNNSFDSTTNSRTGKARKVIRKLTTLSIIFGISTSIAARFIANHSGSAFTSDMQLVSLMSNVSNYMGLVLLFHPLKEMLEGVMIASRDLNFLLWSYGLTAIIFFARLMLSCFEFVDIWKAFVVLHCVRILVFGARAWQKTKPIDGSTLAN